MAINGAIRVDFGEIYPHGAFSVSDVEEARDWDRSTRENHVQQLVRDEEGNPVLVDGLEVRVWQLQVMDGDPSVSMAQKMTVVRIASPRRPVAPATPAGQAGGPGGGGRPARPGFRFRAQGSAAPDRRGPPAGHGGRWQRER